MGKAYQDQQRRLRHKDDHWQRVEQLLTEIRDALKPSPFEQIVGLLQQIVGLQREAVFSLAEIRDALKPPPLPAVPYEQLAAAMDTPPTYDPLAGLRKAAQERAAARFDGPTAGATPLSQDGFPTMGMPYTKGAPTDQQDPQSFAALQGMIAADDPRSSIDPRSPIFRGTDRDNGLIGVWQTAGTTASAIPPGPQTWTPARPAGSLQSPLMAMLSAPLPGKAGPDSIYPDPVLTPGATNPAVTQTTIATTIAVPNWTSTIRPPVSVTGPMKLASMKAYGFTDSPSNYEYDHLISLELGGAPDDPRNIWPQRHADATHDVGSQQKDKLENALKRQVVSGQLTLIEAQTLICTDWYAAYLNLNKMGMIPMTVAYDPSGSDDDDDNA